MKEDILTVLAFKSYVSMSRSRLDSLMTNQKLWAQQKSTRLQDWRQTSSHPHAISSAHQQGRQIQQAAQMAAKRSRDHRGGSRTCVQIRFPRVEDPDRWLSIAWRAAPGNSPSLLFWKVEEAPASLGSWQTQRYRSHHVFRVKTQNFALCFGCLFTRRRCWEKTGTGVFENGFSDYFSMATGWKVTF